jgi:hypothetical protein
MIRCATCGAACELRRHDYYEGMLQKPRRTWAMMMPLYYLGHRPFCSPVCATLGRDVGEMQALT